MSKSLEWVSAGALNTLQEEGSKVIKGGIAVFFHDNQVYAVDNRCPHLGFPLHMGSLCDGILTCHWHHARFDVCSGGTLDPWADNVPSYEVKIEAGEVFVNSMPKQANHADSYKERLREGLQQNIGIVIAKAVVGLVESGVSDKDIARIGIEFGTTYGNGWNSGLTILTAMVRVLPKLDKTGRILALYQGLVHVARQSSGRGTRHLLGPLPAAETSLERLLKWYRSCIEVRDTDGAQKVLLTAAQKGLDSKQLADLMLVAATDHYYLDGGHVFDFHNKAFEALQWAGSEQTERIVTSLLHMMNMPVRSEELHQWQAPIQLVEPIKQAVLTLTNTTAFTSEEHKSVLDEESFLQQLLSDKPIETIEKIRDLLLAGVEPVKLAQLVALAAAERIIRFHTQNDFSDWIAVLHTFTYAHAVHVRFMHSTEPLLLRAIFHGAASVYLDRFLNVPAAARPQHKQRNGAAEGELAVNGSSTEPDDLLNILDQRQQVAAAGQWVVDYVANGGSSKVLWNTLGHALLREDAEFHTFQMYEAASEEYDHWTTYGNDFALRAQETMLLACTRYLAAHAPTARELPHTAKIAWRLYRGERLFEEE
ncbi:Rieske (2Fe-2S) protein [Paenibacillus eucommiae]|uniref:Nitrite reductase/ring-hydroxylating ferredoxin subunit n=1 Tax=Paenibacillus eucommiae TaxID=1355755 RepID=A0ABS4IR53_9BACL|nr:Rieske (2Fe-2S) protein [Paenibacillus eucommiae]MBP1990049.1 nitrite reductase/ring-hydroxylating ferredoxin subunit [Paenibacillus eucommiae]